MLDRRNLKKYGHLTTEYAVIFAVFAVIAVVASLQVIKPTFNKFYNGVGNIIDGTTGQMQGYSSTAK